MPPEPRRCNADLSHTTCGKRAIARYENISSGKVIYRCAEHDPATLRELDGLQDWGRQALT